MSNSFDFKNEKLRQAVEFLELHPNEFTVNQLADRFGLTYDQMQAGIRRGKKRYTLVPRVDLPKLASVKNTPNKIKEYIPPPPDTTNILIIGDLHEPFTLDQYLEFCIDTYKKYKCTHVIFIGDIIDNHAVSYHESDADGMSAGDELEMAIENIQKWYRAFPKAECIIGNHCRLVMRKASTGGIPRRWIRDFQSVLGVHQWTFSERKAYDGVQYIHGEGGTARARCKKDLMSTVQGHLHTQAYTEHFVGSNFHIFGMQVGCGIDKDSYAMAYAKNFGKPAIGVGLVLNHGKLPINVLMEL